jgi:hypothetical protein
MSYEDLVPRNERERRALEEIAAIDNDPTNPANIPGHRDSQAAVNRKQALYRIVLAERNQTVATYRELDDPPGGGR